MKKYIVKKGDTLDSIADQFGVKDGFTLRSYHNIYCPLEDLLGYDAIVGKEILIPEGDPKYLKQEQEIEEIDKGKDNIDSSYKDENKRTNSNEKKNEEKQGENKASSSEHDGKYFVIQRGTCQCDKGFTFPNFKVTSHQKHYWNTCDADSDHLAVTEEDIQFNPASVPFGQCKLRPSSGGYLPCMFAPVGKWQKPYEKVKVLDKSCLTEISELKCATGGKITIKIHGQQIEIGRHHILNADSFLQQTINPIIDFDEFKEEVDKDNYPEFY